MKTKTFLLKDVCNITYGNKFDLQNMTYDDPHINFVSRTGNNNGVSDVVDYIDGKKPYKEGCVTIALGGSIGSTFYQSKPFYTGQNVAVLEFEDNVSIYSKLYICQLIKFEVKNRFRAFGRELNKHIKVDFTIDLPINNEGRIDYEYMENFIKTLHYKEIKSSNTNPKIKLDTTSWKEYKLSDLFDVSAGIYHYSDEYESGETPYVSASNINNGVSQFINLKPDFKGNCIVTGKVGCTAFYEPHHFCATSDVNILRAKNFNMNPMIGLFLVTVINASENYKWNYGRQCRVSDSKEIIIKLPSINEKPDWNYMENYIKSLLYADRI